MCIEPTLTTHFTSVKWHIFPKLQKITQSFGPASETNKKVIVTLLLSVLLKYVSQLQCHHFSFISPSIAWNCHNVTLFHNVIFLYLFIWFHRLFFLWGRNGFHSLNNCARFTKKQSLRSFYYILPLIIKKCQAMHWIKCERLK